MGKDKAKKDKLHGEQAFDAYYEEIYGEEYGVLRESLFGPAVHAELDFGRESYYLDPASVCAALCLPLENARKVADLCAAPGGKTLVLSGNLNDETKLYSNERSPDRKKRLQTVVQTVAPESLGERIIVSCSDASLWCRREQEPFDAILLDAPCSSERHVLQDPKYLKDWSPNRIKTVYMEEWSLMSSAWRLLAPEGYLLYATCALAPKENDGIIERLLEKFDDVQVMAPEILRKTFFHNLENFRGKIILPENLTLEEIFNASVSTRYGFHALPHKAKGTGPLFFCLLQKRPSQV